MPSPLTVVICHGSYHTPEPYQPFLDALEQNEIEAYCPQLPTSDLSKLNVGDISKPNYDCSPPPGGFPQPADDTEVIQNLLRRLVIEEEKNIILIGHSAGGFTATASATPEFQEKTRKQLGASGGILGVFYACAILAPVGESINSFFQPKDGSPPTIPPYCQFHSRGFDGLGSTKDGATYFFNGLDKEKAKYYESTLTATPIPHTVLENDAYAALPCTYLVTENDLALPAAYQDHMVALQSQRPGVSINVVRCPSGHSPQLTWTEGFVAEVKGFGNSLVA